MSPPTDAAILRTHDLTLRYGSLTAVDSVTLEIARGARHALIGPNGAGKSSLFAVLAGRTRATSGTVHLEGQDITQLGEARRARAGLVRTFQHSSLFLGMSVLDNVWAAVERSSGSPVRAWPSPRRDRAIRDAAMTHLENVGLADRHAALCGALSHGERRQVEVAMVLACDPRLILLDEPTAGMSVAETELFASLVESLPRTVTVVVVEHDLDVVFRLAERVSVLAAGRLIADGSPEAVRADDAVQEAYLGRSAGTELFEVSS
ncbi:ABC transporter ATP-binding protein [Georgenia sp. Z1491]|uniref:ABC transporter ATP-binding protein n=1 Tax=Georgenia sp. Z1491 TaxID=3416707 RepID=UPI003CF1FBA0